MSGIGAAKVQQMLLRSGALTDLRALTMTGDIVLIAETDAKCQRLDPAGSNRLVTLNNVATSTYGFTTPRPQFVIAHSGTANTLTVRRQDGTSLRVLAFAEDAVFIWTGTLWVLGASRVSPVGALKLPSTPGAGQASQALRWNNGTGAFEFFTPASTSGSPETFGSATGTISAGTTLAIVTHAAMTALTLPAIPAAGTPLDLAGPATSGAYAILVAAAAHTIEGGGDYLRVDGYGWRLRLLSDGAMWRVVPQRGTVQVPACDLDGSTIAGAGPWTMTDTVSGSSITLTDRSSSGTVSAVASTGLRNAPAGLTAVWASNTGTGFSATLADLALTLDDDFAAIAVYTIGGTWAAAEATALLLGTTVAAVPKAGIQHEAATPNVSARWTSAINMSVGSAAGPHTAVGFEWDSRNRALRPLSFTPSGAPFSAYWPMDGRKPAAVDKWLGDPAVDEATAVDWALLSRILFAASNTTIGETWTMTRLVISRILRPTG